MSEHPRRPLTPHEIRYAKVRTVGFRKGYDPGAVHDLLRRLAEETANRERVIADLTGRLRRAEAEAYARRHGTLPATTPVNLDEMDSEIDRHVQAQQYADELIASAQEGAAQIVEHGRQQASRILSEAHVAADQAVHQHPHGDAHSQVDREELLRLLALAQWAQAQLAGLHQQIQATDATVGKELRGIADRLRPVVEAYAASH